MLPTTDTSTITERMKVLVHTLNGVFIAVEPALRSKVIRIFPKDLLIAMQHRLIDLYFVATGKEPATYFGTSRRHVSRQASADDCMTPHAFFYARGEVGHLSSILVFDGAVSMHHGIDFSLELCIYFRALDDTGHDLTCVSGRDFVDIFAHHRQRASAGV